MKIAKGKRIDPEKLEDITAGNNKCKEFWNLGISQILNARDLLQRDNKYSFGELVVDNRYGEIGMVVGAIKPNFKEGMGPSNSKEPYYLLLTIEPAKINEADVLRNVVTSSSADSDRLKMAEDAMENRILEMKENGGRTRIRYARSKYITRLGLVEAQDETMGDLEDFCKYQCILDCSSECVLHKYGCSPRTP